MSAAPSAAVPVKVLVVDDSVLMQKLMTQIIDSAPGFKVIGVAGSAEEGWDAIQDLRPDVVTLDLELPGRHGLKLLARVLKQDPLPVLIVSAFGGPGADNSRKGQRRDLKEPGSFYEYNDVRVNVLSYALLQLFRRPLPEVLRERIMDPIGASPDWRWEGYSSSFVEIDGKRIQSVPGGGHWGGGLFIGARDHARFGLLMARRGEWNGRQIVSRDWIERSLTPSPTLGNYGYLWWLARGPAARPGLPETAFSALGAGSNVIWVEPEQGIVAVLRWINGASTEGFIDRLLAARS